VSIDLNVPGAREVAVRLCDTADVIVENFRPAALAAFALEYDAVPATNPSVVYASISGYGQHGAWRWRMAYAPNVQAETGITANTVEHFDRADRLRSDSLSHVDVYSGLHAAIAILACLTERARTGKGRARRQPDEPRRQPVVPVLSRGDAPARPRQRRAIPHARAATAQPGRLHHVVQEWIWTFADMETLDAQLDEAKIATGQVRSVKEFAAGGWAREWNAVRTVSDRTGGEIKIPGRPRHFADQIAPDNDQLGARQGEHNTEVLSELRFSAVEIGALQASGALIQPNRKPPSDQNGVAGIERRGDHIGADPEEGGELGIGLAGRLGAEQLRLCDVRLADRGAALDERDDGQRDHGQQGAANRVCCSRHSRSASSASTNRSIPAD